VGLIDTDSGDLRHTCTRCGTEMPAFALACPSCAAFVHAGRLRELAALAGDATAAGNRAAARQHWQDAQALVPRESEQHRLLGERAAALLDAATPPLPSADTATSDRSWWKQLTGGALAIGLLLGGKLKFLLLGLTKLSTVTSMFGFIAVYWALHGWPLAVGLGVSIYIHEMGHVAVLRRLGIHAGAPLFIPGVGAVVMLKEHVTDPLKDALIGLAGPIWGLGAALAAGAVYLWSGASIWLAICELTALMNLFNLTPIWQLDGSRGFHALSEQQRWMAATALSVTALVTGQGLLWLVLAVAVFRAMKSEPGPGDVKTLGKYIGLAASLGWLARGVH
jgi:Zn-dependent protease